MAAPKLDPAKFNELVQSIREMLPDEINVPNTKVKVEEDDGLDYVIIKGRRGLFLRFALVQGPEGVKGELLGDVPELPYNFDMEEFVDQVEDLIANPIYRQEVQEGGKRRKTRKSGKYRKTRKAKKTRKH